MGTGFRYLTLRAVGWIEPALSILLLSSILAAGTSGTSVELECIIAPRVGELGYKLWSIELQQSSGRLVQQEIKGTGDKIRFKDLAPGIYVLCISGEKGSRRCESVDLTPAAGQASPKFKKRMTVPAFTAGQPDKYRVSARRLLVPKAASEELLRSESAELRGDSRESLAHLERALEIFPDYPEALNNIGVRHHRIHEFEKAIQCFRKATRIDKDFYPAWINLGASLLAVGQFTSALEANARAHELRPNEPLPNSQMAMNYYYLHDYEKAKKYFLRVQALDPLSATSPLLYLAHIAVAQKQSNDAETYIRRYLELHPNSPQAPSLREALSSLMTEGGQSRGMLGMETGP